MEDLRRLFRRAQARRGLRKRTISDRDHLLARLEVVAPLRKVTTEQIEAWLDRCNLSTPGSRASYITSLHAFYEWCVIHGYRKDDPTVAIDRPKLPRRLPRPIGDDDLDVALAMANPRMKAWLSLACYEGFRCMEIAQLQREDVLDKHEPPLLKVPDGKGGKEGMLPLHPDVLDALNRYGLPKSGPVFLSARGKAYSPITISGYIGEYLHGLGLHDTAHRLRHWFGTTLYGSTHDLRLTQEMMRHSDPTSTAGYVLFDRPQAQEAVTSLRPRKKPPQLWPT